MHEVYTMVCVLCRETEESKKFSFKSLQLMCCKEVCHNNILTCFLQQFFMQEERERNDVAMYETVDDPSHTPAPYEEVREVKRSQDIQLTSNEAYGPILRENIQTTPNTAYGQVHL